ncbi:hypothetical protein OG194_26910 [Streptomyces sp. NBC_01288]|uniref:hypothetical protein n=1 Tax=Streptomyces sp. NBC_01288 TaxID=2903814 RepID=UPI002E0F3BC1|nr:hypothetical protein OG194_26910 [Streptomyces sp. NBC_01288]
MMTSTFLVSGASALGGVVLSALSQRQQRQFFAWTRNIRRKDETNTDFDKPAEWLGDLYKAQCGLTRKPCVADDFVEISRTGNMIEGIADDTEAVRLVLTKVVECVRDYVATALPEVDPAAAHLGVQECHARLVQAMRQEAARGELVRAILAAQKRIKDLRRS